MQTQSYQLKNQSLSKENKKKNFELSKIRIKIEHTFEKIKIFRIFKYPYRDNLKGFAKRMKLALGIYNTGLKLTKI